MKVQQNSPKNSATSNSKNTLKEGSTQTICEQLQILEFPHQAPAGYSYEFKPFKRNIISIWLLDHRKYVYNGGSSVRCIWGFYNSKTNAYYAPINSSTVGSVVQIKDTTQYSAMQIKQNPLISAFV